jgi:hypothetical protein
MRTEVYLKGIWRINSALENGELILKQALCASVICSHPPLWSYVSYLCEENIHSFTERIKE